MTILLFCFIVLLALLSGNRIFAGFGSAICTFMYGTFGYGCFLVIAALAYLGVWLAFEKSVKLKLRPTLFACLTLYALFLLFHAVSTRNFDINDNYINQCYLIAAQGFPSYTFGGVLSAILVYPVALVTTFTGAYIIFALLAVLGGYFTVLSVKKHCFGGKFASREAVAAHSESAAGYAESNPQPVQDNYSEGYGVQTEQPQYAQSQYAQPQYQQAPVQPAYDAGYNGYAQPQPADYSAPVQPLYQQPDGGMNQGGAYGQNYSDDYSARPYFTAQHMMSSSEHKEEDKFSPEKLGRKIILDRDEFAAESYRRNGIFDENSYFNHPIRNDGDYIRGFTEGKGKSKGTTVEPATYSEAYRQSVDKQPSEPHSGILYGDAPAKKLEDIPSSQNSVSAQNVTSYTAPSYTEPETDSGNEYTQEGPIVPEEIDLGAPETEIDDSAELFGGNSQSAADFAGDSAQTSAPEQPPVDTRGDFASRLDSRRLDDALFGTSETRADSSRTEGLSRRDDFGGVSDSRSDFGQEFSSRGELSRNNDTSRGGEFSRGADVSRRETSFGMQSESSRNEDIIKSDDSSRTEDFSRRGELGENRRMAGFGEPASDNISTDSSSDGGRGGDNGISSLFSSTNSRLGEGRIEPDISRLSSRRDRSNANLFDDDSPSDGGDIFGGRREERAEEPPAPAQSVQPAQPVQPVRRETPSSVQQDKTSASESAPAEEKKPPHVWKKYVRPSLDLLEDYPEYNSADTAEVEESKRIIVETLESFKIDCVVSDVVVGPAITRFDVIIQDRTNIKNSLRYRESIAMALKKENVNAYLNYSKGALSIEVPNSKRSTVGLKSMMLSSSYINAKTNSLTFALGKNVEGACICPDITKMPHLLVAGTTGSGKSICLSSLLISLLYKYGPEELRFILVDPKQVEFISYDKLPHLMINEIIYDVDKAIKALNWAIKEMERRYTLFKDMTETGANAKGNIKIATKDLNEYNAHLEEGQEKLPKIVIVLDEFGDLMLQAKKDIESRIIKLVQKARAAGIHLILATQRPSVDCITGLIKSNLPTRIGFKVGSFDDSRTIFDIGGAEKLLGRGDMYFRSAERPDLMRIQGCFVDTPEVQKVTDFIKQHNETYFDQSVSDFINKVEEPEQAAGLSDGGETSEETKIDDTFIRALKYCVMSNAASVSMIQRRFPIGYIKACKIVDWMENMNYITKAEGSKSRKVLLSKEEFINTYGDIDD